MIGDSRALLANNLLRDHAGIPPTHAVDLQTIETIVLVSDLATR
jgi:hypothetical protein